MRVLRLPALLLVAVAVGAGAVGCSQTIAGSGSVAAGAATGTSAPSPSPTGSDDPSPSPTETSDSPSPTPTSDAVTVRRRALCVLERASITSINSQFNKAKTRDAQVGVLRSGATQITGHLSRSKLPSSDRIYAFGKAVLSQLNNLVRLAQGGASPSTKPYNDATTNFQKACSSV